MNGFYATENRKYDFYKSLLEERAQDDSVYYSQSATLSDAGDINLGNLFIDFGAGYVVKHKMDDLYLFAALIGNYSYVDARKILLYRSTNLDKSLNPVEKTIEKGSHLKIPFYVNYYPTNWFELNGGYTVHYLYRMSETTFNNSSSEGAEHELYSNSYSNLVSFNSIFLGINLKHKSGFRVQVAFNNSLTSYSRWNLSLGYLY